MDVKRRLQDLMDERGWTIYHIAKEAGIPWSTVRNMFVRDTDPSMKTLECVCNGLGISLSQFFDTENKMGLSAEQAHLLQQWSLLQEKDRRLITELMDSLKEKK